RSAAGQQCYYAAICGVNTDIRCKTALSKSYPAPRKRRQPLDSVSQRRAENYEDRLQFKTVGMKKGATLCTESNRY
ncbi:MAG TPA: hypothetical protein VF719_10160, partial [Abditibacteriaceae bacterium]